MKECRPNQNENGHTHLISQSFKRNQFQEFAFATRVHRAHNLKFSEFANTPLYMAMRIYYIWKHTQLITKMMIQQDKSMGLANIFL